MASKGEWVNEKCRQWTQRRSNRVILDESTRREDSSLNNAAAALASSPKVKSDHVAFLFNDVIVLRPVNRYCPNYDTDPNADEQCNFETRSRYLCNTLQKMATLKARIISRSMHAPCCPRVPTESCIVQLQNVRKRRYGKQHDQLRLFKWWRRRFTIVYW